MAKMKIPKEEYNVVAKSFWEFRKLLKLCYNLGYHFNSGNKYSAFNLWVGWGFCIPSCKGLSLYDDNSIKYIEDTCEIDYIDYDEFLRIIHGVI